MTAILTRHNVEAERVLLGKLIGSPLRADSTRVGASDLDPALGHPEVWSAILTVAETYEGTCDPPLLLAELNRRGVTSQIGREGARGGVYLAELLEAGGMPGTMGHYAALIRESTVRRELHEVGSQLVRNASTQGDLDVVLENASFWSARLGGLVGTALDGDVPIRGLGTVADFIAEASPPHAWVIPGILEHGDRVMLVAGEGTGKSVVARQLCTLLAAGRHPFAPEIAIRPRRTLLVDLENPPDLVRRSLRDIVGKVYAEGLDVGDRAWKWLRPGGLDLRTPADRALFTQVVDRTRPDLIAFGPLYKASLGRSGDTYEAAAADLAATLDRIRERYGCAFWIEHHMGKGDGGQRHGPIGSSFWLRWPEFGLELKEDPDDSTGRTFILDRFRGHRDERCWPDRLRKHGDRWPWTPSWDDDQVKHDLFDAADEDAAAWAASSAPAPDPGQAGPTGPPASGPGAPSGPVDVASVFPSAPVVSTGLVDGHSPPVTRDQLAEVAAAFNRAGLIDRFERLGKLTELAGRPIESPTELTRVEAERVLAHLAGPATSEVSQPADQSANVAEQPGDAQPQIPVVDDPPDDEPVYSRRFTPLLPDPEEDDGE